MGTVYNADLKSYVTQLLCTSVRLNNSRTCCVCIGHPINRCRSALQAFSGAGFEAYHFVCNTFCQLLCYHS